MRRVGLGLMSIFLLLAAVVQYNDPDGYVWMLVYGLPAIVTTSAFITTKVMNEKWWWLLCVAVLLVLLVFFLIMVSPNFHEQKIPLLIIKTEEGREFAGLLIVLCWMMILVRDSSLNNNNL